MIRLILSVLILAVFGAIVGAIGVYFLADGLPEGAIAGALLGGSAGIFLATRIDARLATAEFARGDPEIAKLSQSRRSALRQQVRRFEYDESRPAASGHFLKKLDDYASAAEAHSNDSGAESKP